VTPPASVNECFVTVIADTIGLVSAARDEPIDDRRCGRARRLGARKIGEDG